MRGTGYSASGARLAPELGAALRRAQQLAGHARLGRGRRFRIAVLPLWLFSNS
jgi:hypothetical protein